MGLTPLEDVDPRLVTLLREAGDEWGALGVALAAAQLTERRPVLAALTPTDEDEGGLVEWARRELAHLVSEDPEVIEGTLDALRALRRAGILSSQIAAMVTAERLSRLLRYEPLTPLTDDTDEWMEVTAGSWQSRRNPEAFSEDGGVTYYLLSERDAAGSMETTPLHRSECVGAGR